MNTKKQTEVISTERAILHCDLNNFYASVEMALNPKLKGKAIAVCGREEDRHGIVLAKSEKAKKYGVKTGDVIWQAKNKCRDLIVLEPNFDEYVKYGKAVRQIYYEYTDLIEPFGLDECWLDITASKDIYGSDYELAYKLKEQVKREMGLTISIGVSFNKVFAKLGSDLKKPDGITVIRKDNFKDKIWCLPASDMLWVGRSTARVLKDYGIETIGELANTSADFLVSVFGKNGYSLWKCANGKEDSIVSPFEYTPEVKSIGRGCTLSSDLETDNDVWKIILSLSHNVSKHLREDEFVASGVQITVKSNDLKSVQFQKKLDFATQNAKEIAENAFNLYLERYDKKLPVRALTIRAIDLYPYDIVQQLNIFFDINKHIRHEIIEETVLALNRRYGKFTVIEATLLNENRMPTNKTDEVLLPSARFR